MFAVSLDYRLTLKGENTIDTPYTEGPSAVGLVAPSGIVENKNVLHLNASVDPFTFLGVVVDLYGVYTTNFDNAAGLNVMDFQAVISVRAGL
jgi:hypothetical protein